MVPGTLLYVIVIPFFASSLASNDDSAYVDLSPGNDTVSRLEGPPKIVINDTAITDEETTHRDKRALGVILQGLVEALGYTVSPISYASLPNPNTTSPAPPQKPIATSASGPAPMTTMAPRQRETLRLTGVLNFGNNSDLLGHLQQYERIFHGNATSTAAPAPGPPPPPPARPLPPPGPASGKPALLTPFFVPIPLPLAPDLVPLPPSAPRRAKLTELTYAKQQNKESYDRESQEISDEKDVRKDPPGRESDRDTYVDEPRWMKKQREKQEDGRKKYREENDRESDSSEENEEIEQKNKYREQEIADREREDAADFKQQEVEQEEKESAEEDDKKSGYREDEEENDDEDSRGEEKYTKKSEDTEDDRENTSIERDSDDESTDGERSVKSNANAEATTSRSDYDKFDEPFDYSPRKIPPIPKQFGNRLPIRVFDEPFSTRGGLRNSYGESLEQGGKIDESVADYFQRYKNPETGLFDSRKIQSLQGPREKDHWWRSDQMSVPGLDSDPLDRIRHEYAPPANKRYEEDNSKRQDSEAGQQKSRKDDPEERIYDEEVESTEEQSRSVEGRSGTSTSKNTIQYPRIPANTRYEEYESKSEDGEVVKQRIRKKGPEENGYEEGVKSTESKDKPVKGRTRARTFMNTIQHPRVLATTRYEDTPRHDSEVGEQRSQKENPEQKKYAEGVDSTKTKSVSVDALEDTITSKGEIQHPRVPANTWYKQDISGKKIGGVKVGEHEGRNKDPEDDEHDEKVESTEPKYRPVIGRGRAIFKNPSIQYPRVPANSRYEEYDSKSDNAEVGRQRNRKKNSEEKAYDERGDSTRTKSRSVEDREGTTTSTNTVQPSRIPENERFEEYNSEGKDADRDERRSRKKHFDEEEYDERVVSAQPKYRPVEGWGRVRMLNNVIQPPRVSANTRHEEYDPNSDDGEVQEQRSRQESREEPNYNEGLDSIEGNSRSVEGREGTTMSKHTIQHSRVPVKTRYEEYNSEEKDDKVGEQRARKKNSEEEHKESVEPTEPKYRPVKGRERARMFKNTVQYPKARANPRYEEYNLPREDDLVVERTREAEDSEEKKYDERAQTTDSKYRPTIGRSRARAFQNYEEEDESSGSAAEVGRTEVRERETTSRDEDDEEVIAEPTVTTYTHVNALEEIGNSNYEDGIEESKEASPYEPSSEKINLSDYGSVEESTGLSKFQLLDPKNPLLFKGFDFIKYSPYFRPIQVSYEPAKLRRTAARILSYHNFDDDASHDKSRSSEQFSDKNVGLTQRLATAAVRGDAYITHNPYLKPIQVVYEPEKLQRTADRILSYHNTVGRDESPEKAKHEIIGNEEETKQEEEEKRDEGHPVHNSKESRGPSKSYEEEDGRSASNASNDDEPSQNYEDRKNHSVDKSNGDEGTSRNYEEQEDCSSVNREMENNAKHGVGLPEKLTGKQLHEGESKELRAWPAPFDHTFDSTERAKVTRLPNFEASTKIRDEDVEPTYETPAYLEFQSNRPDDKYPADADVAPTYDTPVGVELRTSDPSGYYPVDSDVSPTDESPSTEKSLSTKPTVSRSNSKTRRRLQSGANKNNGQNDHLETEDKQPRVTKDAQDRSMIQSSRLNHHQESENSKSQYINPTIRLQIFEPNEEGSRPEQRRDVEVREILKLPGHQRKFEDSQSAHDFFGFGRDDYVLMQDANNAQKYGEHAPKTTTPSGSNEKELKGFLVITHDPNQQDEVILTKFTDEPETETEKVKVNEYRNKVTTLKVSERRQSTPDGRVQHVGFKKSL